MTKKLLSKIVDYGIDKVVMALLSTQSRDFFAEDISDESIFGQLMAQFRDILSVPGHETEVIPVTMLGIRHLIKLAIGGQGVVIAREDDNKSWILPDNVRKTLLQQFHPEVLRANRDRELNNAVVAILRDSKKDDMEPRCREHALGLAALLNDNINPPPRATAHPGFISIAIEDGQARLTNISAQNFITVLYVHLAGLSAQGEPISQGTDRGKRDVITHVYRVLFRNLLAFLKAYGYSGSIPRENVNPAQAKIVELTMSFVKGTPQLLYALRILIHTSK